MEELMQDAWAEYPRPQLKKGFSQILNDGWKLDGNRIRVPFPPQAKLSEYEGEIKESFTYEKECILGEEIQNELWQNGKKRGHLLLHFGAVDQIADVFVDNKKLFHHEGGYLPFTVDITECLEKEAFLLRLEGTDSLDIRFPYGKQSKQRGGMWYTPVSGIWQTVWCEWVPECYITRVEMKTHETRVEIEVCMSQETTKEAIITLFLQEGTFSIETWNHRLSIELSDLTNVEGKKHYPVYWNPDHPYLYDVEVSCGEDVARTYFGLRSVSIRQVAKYQRICINEDPVFLHGVLDQGYHENGIFLPEEAKDYERDIFRMKELGFNTLRKHIKIEPELFYYACDRLGILVLQDMVNNGPYSFVKDTLMPTMGLHHKKDIKRYQDAAQKENFVKQAEETIALLKNHPSIIGYTIFNEGWGQTDSDEIGDYLKSKDPSRFYDYTSGWFTQKHSDVESLHVYFRPKHLEATGKPLILSEFGGFSRNVEGHMLERKKTYGYGHCADEKELTDRIVQIYETMVKPAIPRGLCGAIYTQLSDIEDEVNGFYTYDREVCKVDRKRIRDMLKNAGGVLDAAGGLTHREERI